MGALVAGVAARFGDRVDVRGHIRPLKHVVGLFWEFGAGTEERGEDTGATIIGPMIRSDGRVIVNFALDVKIGAVRDRPTQSMHITCVCRS